MPCAEPAAAGELRVPSFLRGLACAVFEDGPIFKKEVLELFALGRRKASLQGGHWGC